MMDFERVLVLPQIDLLHEPRLLFVLLCTLVLSSQYCTAGHHHATSKKQRGTLAITGAATGMALSLTADSGCWAAFAPPPFGPPLHVQSFLHTPRSGRAPIGKLESQPWVLRELSERNHRTNSLAKNSRIKMAGMEAGTEKGDGMLRSPNLGLLRILVKGEVAVGTAAAILAAILQVNPLSGLELTSSAFVTGCLGALPIFIASVLLEKSGVGFFRKIDQDTKLYVVQLFGAERNLPAVFLWSAVLAANAGFFEELLFRGVIQQWLLPLIGAWPALGITSVLFGLAHNPVPGASSFTEACYGANFGFLYMMSGGNIFVPIVAHIVYDLLTFLEVHNRATAQLQVTLKGRLPEDRKLQANVKKVTRDFKLPEKFVDMSYAVFKQLDLDANGAIDQQELQLGLRTFGKFASDEETRQIMQKADLDENNALTFDEWVRLLALNYGALLKAINSEKLGNEPAPN